MELARSLDLDAYKPAEIARLIERSGVAKARLGTLQTLTLGLLAGAFIAMGSMFYTLVMTGDGLGFGPARLLGGLVFSLGLILVVIAGAELFTGNNLIVMAWVDRRITLLDLARNWTLVYVANFIGAVGTAVLLTLSGTLALGDGAVRETAFAIALAKTGLVWHEALFRGLLCNALVCLAVWLTFAARDVTGKILAILLPIAAFVALGFEHSVANMYFIPLAWMNGAPGVGIDGLLANLVPVTVGNIIGGGGFVGLTYWLCYRPSPASTSHPDEGIRGTTTED
ncbi:MAG TPA: formate/nitrite transporter family protein [Geminicoccaceae bacterium]|jgi:formate/nitrite transporter|nr:formate/nitrite transporter family protein [Geminicoccaceae bacterium]HRY24129.1 formate/nitrite transporter family protein [Geminicoccaceae bacterium]